MEKQPIAAPVAAHNKGKDMKRNQYYRPSNMSHMKAKRSHSGAIIILVLAILVIFAASAKACDEVYLKVGASYKFAETDKIELRDGSTVALDIHSPIGARFELGKQHGNFSYGIAHQSQWLVGRPVDDRKEYSRSEVFIDYKWSWK